MLHFDPVRFAAFELYYSSAKEQKKTIAPSKLNSKDIFEAKSEAELRTFESSLIDVFPGVSFNYTIQDARHACNL